LAKPEGRKVVALGNLDNRWLGRAFRGEKLRQLLPKKAGVRSHDAVFAAVVSRRAMKDVHADLLFTGGFRSFLKGAFSAVKEKFTKP
jgi:hypothetical protein